MKLVLENVRLSFPHLFEAQPPMNGVGAPKFNAQFLMEKGSANEKKAMEAFNAAAKDKWGVNVQKILNTVEASKKCLRDGDNNLDKAGETRNGYEGMTYLSASTKMRPTVVDRNRAPLTEADGRPYGGCYVNVIVDVYALDTPVKGVFAELKGVQFVKDGDAFGGGSPARADDFGDLGDDPDAAF